MTSAVRKRFLISLASTLLINLVSGHTFMRYRTFFIPTYAPQRASSFAVERRFFSRCILSSNRRKGNLPSLKTARSRPSPVVVTARHRSRKPDPCREHIGLAKGLDTGKYRPYSAANFIPAGSGLPDLSKPFVVLGIETSCDDTGVAIVRSDGEILGEALASQYKIHEEWGGVVPGLARDAHASVIDSMIDEALSKAGFRSVEEVDAVGVTVGPGLEICLRVGCNKAKELAEQYKKPFVTVHHLEAHCLMARLGEKGNPHSSSGSTSELSFPFLALLVSGGHCMILECQGIGQYHILGGTLDDALGEAYDKAARLLKVGSGAAGGPALEKLARDGDPRAISLPVPMKAKKDMNFSYAGLKNAFRMAVTRARGAEEEEDLDAQKKADLAAAFQDVAIKHLEERLERAMEHCEREGGGNIRKLAVVGGVAANQELRSRLQALCAKRSKVGLLSSSSGSENDEEERSGGAAAAEWELLVPPPRLCTDNGVMVAWAAIEKLKLGCSDVTEGQDVYARWPFAAATSSTTAK